MFGSILNLVIQGVLGGDARVETFIVLAVLSLLATFDVLPFSKMFNKSQKELDEKRAAAA